MTQMQVTMPENVMDEIRSKATLCGVSPNILVRIQLCQIYSSTQPDASSKSCIIEIKNWQEIEAYVKERGFGNIGIFLNKAAEWYMKKYHLSTVQKAAIKENIVKREKAPADASAGL